MIVSVREARERKSDLDFIEHSLGSYLDDLGVAHTGLFHTLPEIGHAGPDQLAAWLADGNARLLTILDGTQPVGFALVLRVAGDQFRMSEFFVAPAVRRRGVGRRAARLILDRFSGQWEVVENQRNAAAVQFWRQVIAQYTGGEYRERVAGGEVRQLFRSEARR